VSGKTSGIRTARGTLDAALIMKRLRTSARHGFERRAVLAREKPTLAIAKTCQHSRSKEIGNLLCRGVGGS